MVQALYNPSMEILFWVAAAGMCGIISANFFARRMFSYDENLARVDRVVRDVFWAQHVFLELAIFGMALLCVVFPTELKTTTLGRSICGFLALFWVSRLCMQFFHYSKEQRARYRGFDVMFLANFAYLTTVFACGAAGVL